MSYYIADNIATIKFENGELQAYVLIPKAAIQEISIVRGSVVKIQTSKQCLYIPYKDIGLPYTPSIGGLVLLMNTWLGKNLAIHYPTPS